ncbi:MAG TPA: hypothetical protein VF666_07390 [Pyrinomonadaceae bacterium]|jgi:glucose-6-phosphate isomerase
MINYNFEPIVYDPSNTLIGDTGLAREDLENLTPRLEDARREVLSDLELLRSGAAIPDSKKPLDAGFIDFPERLLDEYRQRGGASEIGRILTAAQQLSEMVDRVVVIGIGGSYMGTRSLFEACCHPYHNELGRMERRHCPRIYFIGHNVDNDLAQGLLDVLGRERQPVSVEERWGIVVVSKSGETLEPAVAFRQFLTALRKAVGSKTELLPKLVIPIAGAGSKLFEIGEELGCENIFEVPNHVGGRFSILTAVGLAPAAVLGLDIVKLLEGAAAMNERFRTAAPGQNPVLDFVSVCHLMEKKRGADVRVLSIWDEGLEAVGFWYDQLLSESLGKNGHGATPITVVNTRDLHSRGQQHQEGQRDKLITNLILKQARREPLPVGFSESNQDNLNSLANKTLPEIMSAAIAGTTRAYLDGERPTADIYLPQADEASLGQLYQMLMLATSVEGRLIGVNPYGQPGVEAYKKHMKSILSEGA